MISVVEEDNVASPGSSQPFDHPRRWLRFPIACHCRPHHDPGAAVTPNDRIELRAPETEWRPHPSGDSAGRGLNRCVAVIQLLIDAVGRKKCKLGMRLGVIAYRVSALGDFLRERGKCANVLTNQKKCGMGFVAIKQLEQLGRGGRIWPIVKRQGHRRRVARAANGPAEQLRRRGGRAPSKGGGGGTRRSRCKQNRKHVHE